jgi:hypothetical protein
MIVKTEQFGAEGTSAHSTYDCDDMTLTPVPSSVSPHYLSWLILFLAKCSYQTAIYDSNMCFVGTLIAFLISVIIIKECSQSKKEIRLSRSVNLLISWLLHWLFDSSDLSGDKPRPFLPSIRAFYVVCEVCTDQTHREWNREVGISEILDYLACLCEVVRVEMTCLRLPESRRLLAKI